MTRIASVATYPISVPRPAPVWTAHEEIKAWSVILTEIKTDDGLTGYGEIHGAPAARICDWVARFSQILAHNGFNIVGNGDMNEYLYGGLTTQIWRLSLGLGYRFSPNLVFKGEYTFERGKEASGDVRNHEDLFAVEAAFKF